MLEIPPKPSADEAGVNSLQMAFRSRFKLFFRPAGLPGSAPEAPAALRWELGSRNGKPVLVAHNPTPYHVSPVTVEVIAGEHLVKATEPDMIAPGATAAFQLDGEVRNPAGATVRVHCINDFGGRDQFSAPLSASGSR
ncbi:Chaperone protein EcpD precursor [compost metagenome]